MTLKELRKKIGLKKNELFNTNIGAMDIFNVKDDVVYYGFLMGSGEILSEPVDSFLQKALMKPV